MRDKRLLEGCYGLITGGSRGIGRAIAETLAEAGCGVAISSRYPASCRAVADEIARRYGVPALGIGGDVSHQESVAGIFRELEDWSGGRLEVLVCNAGYPFTPEIWDTPLEKTTPAQLESWFLDIFRTDTMGAVYCTREALGPMMRRRKGSILYISSTPALEGYRGTAYTIAKAGLLGLMKDVACQYGHMGIRANALALGNIRTAATYDQLDPATRAALAGEAPLGRWGAPEEVGRAALFLASDLSSFVTGQTLVVDGGTVRW